MHAHKFKVVAEPSREIVIRLPADFPAGTAEVIVISEVRVAPPEKAAMHERPTPGRRALLEALARRAPRDPALGPVVFHEDPTAPLEEADWPAELRP